MRAATEIIHGSQGVNRHAEPLTTPIYETTTFLFDSAEDVKAYNEGRSAMHLYSRYTNPTVMAAERKLGVDPSTPFGSCTGGRAWLDPARATGISATR